MASKKKEHESNGDGRTARRPKVKLPPGVAMRPVAAGFRPAGFLIVPTDEEPAPTSFVGILRSVSTRPDPKRPDKPNVWGVFEAVGEQAGQVYDRETDETLDVKPGMLVGISRKGALQSSIVDDHVGHLFEFTGKKIKLSGGRNPMWEALAEMSEEPYTQTV